MGDFSELLTAGDEFGGLTYAQIVKLANSHDGKIYAEWLAV